MSHHLQDNFPKEEGTSREPGSWLGFVSLVSSSTSPAKLEAVLRVKLSPTLLKKEICLFFLVVTAVNRAGDFTEQFRCKERQEAAGGKRHHSEPAFCALKGGAHGGGGVDKVQEQPGLEPPERGVVIDLFGGSEGDSSLAPVHFVRVINTEQTGRKSIHCVHRHIRGALAPALASNVSKPENRWDQAIAGKYGLHPPWEKALTCYGISRGCRHHLCFQKWSVTLIHCTKQSPWLKASQDPKLQKT
ncbi:Zinc Finger Cchc Domain-Containing Protein 3 [Manis pentadactyla]|nr:Zinc Finger Cchc Domain-Containing Protein 3 [Manis pentadactyla]